MTGGEFEAAWVPYSVEDTEVAVAVAVAVALALQVAGGRTGRGKVAALPSMRVTDVTPSLQRFCRVAEVVSPRSRGRFAGEADVLAYVPGWELLDLATLHGRGGSVTVVEGYSPVVRGWAQAVGAENLATGEQTPDPADDEDRELIHQIEFSGNNGWSRHYSGARLVSRRWLQQLADRGRVDRARVLGGVFAAGSSPSKLKELEALIDETFGPTPSNPMGLLRVSHARDALRCPVDGFPMLDEVPGLQQCRSCGHVEESTSDAME